MRYGKLILFIYLTIFPCSVFAAAFQASPSNISRYPKALPGFTTYHYAANEAMQLQEKLLNLANYYSKLTYVPYIWGGGVVGSRKDCNDCRACVENNKVSLKSRLQVCTPCQRCGIDCSHFVFKIFRDAGLDYRYASSWELTRQSKDGLLKHYNLVDIGNQLTLAQPGDVLVYPRHVAMLARVVSPTHGDIVHATRFRWGDPLKLGGFQWERNRNLKNYRGKLIKILRHFEFFDQNRPFAQVGFHQVFDKVNNLN